MFNRWLTRVALLCYILFLFLFIQYAYTIVTEIRAVIYLFIDQLLPIFFPFLILLQLILTNPEKTWLIQWLYPFMKKTCHLNRFGTLTTCLSLISSFPLGAVMVREGYLDRRLTKAEAHHLLMFTNQASPIFISTIVVTFFFKTKTLGNAIIVIQWLTNISIAFLFQFYYRSKRASYEEVPSLTPNPLPITNNNDLLIKTAKTLFTILSMMIMARFIQVLFTSLHVFDFQARLLIHLLPWSLDPLHVQTILQATVELTQGIDLLRITPFGPAALFFVTNALINFHGLSIHMQVYGLIKSTDLSFKPYLLSRVVAVLISLIYSYIYLFIAQPFGHSEAVTTFFEMQKEPSPLSTMMGLSSLYFGLCLMVTLRSSYAYTRNKHT
ncbi:MAG: hypothetical protein ACQER2_00060 [Bacillota bacterium]